MRVMDEAPIIVDDCVVAKPFEPVNAMRGRKPYEATEATA
jgi:hypothetical protein